MTPVATSACETTATPNGTLCWTGASRGDVLDLLEGRPVDPDRQRDRDDRALRAFADDFGFEVLPAETPTVRSKRGRVMALLHPFESTAPGFASVRATAIRDQHPDAILQSTFNLLRIPGTLAGQLLTG